MRVIPRHPGTSGTRALGFLSGVWGGRPWPWAHPLVLFAEAQGGLPAQCPLPAWGGLAQSGGTKHRQQSALDGCPEEPRAVPRPLSRWDSWEEALFLSPYPRKGQPQGKQTPPQPGTKGQRSTSPRAAHPLPTHHHQGNTGRPSPNAPRLLCKDQRASLRAPSWELQHHQVQGDLGHRTGDAAVRRHQGDGMNL